MPPRSDVNKPDPAVLAGAVHSRRAALYLMLGFGSSLMPMPYNVVAILPLGAAVWSSVQALRAVSTRAAPRGIRLWSGLGLALTSMLLVTTAAPYVFYGATRDYRDCLEGANTQAAKQACHERFGAGTDVWRRVLTPS